jgi:hypothetical protein
MSVRSHWDRLPAELQLMVCRWLHRLQMAGVLTQLLHQVERTGYSQYRLRRLECWGEDEWLRSPRGLFYHQAAMGHYDPTSVCGCCHIYLPDRTQLVCPNSYYFRHAQVVRSCQQQCTCFPHASTE